ncbi:hypothetical protein BD309DRAFT_381995 [Dichomitus squalens]|uniref:Uncharacterized protein n=1 Tax=Dichomitus squalens TaxID=114155 RepID=A0A4Q9Q8G4_9APHY|nr:hypothetical protein BD309DRAFT_381995 [Dichomitus squalens]TBU62894.1 hypothetical protein BD310DRAFT_657214 [Dichomitus squalens]
MDEFSDILILPSSRIRPDVPRGCSHTSFTLAQFALHSRPVTTFSLSLFCLLIPMRTSLLSSSFSRRMDSTCLRFTTSLRRTSQPVLQKCLCTTVSLCDPNPVFSYNIASGFRAVHRSSSARLPAAEGSA